MSDTEKTGEAIWKADKRAASVVKDDIFGRVSSKNGSAGEEAVVLYGILTDLEERHLFLRTGDLAGLSRLIKTVADKINAEDKK